MNSLENKFEKDTEQVEDNVRKLEKDIGLDSSKIDDNLSKSMPNHFIKMSAKKNLERLKILAKKIELDDISEGEMEEYGWRLINQK